MENLQEYRWKLIAGGMVVLVMMLFLFIVWPLITGGIQNLKQADSLQSRIDRGANWEITTKKIEDERQEIESFFSRVASDTPGSRNMSNTLEKFFEIAGESAVSIQQISPSESIYQETYREIPIEIRFSGSYHNIAHMINKLEHLGYWLKPEYVRIRSGQDNFTVLDGEILVSVYHMNLPQTN